MKRSSRSTLCGQNNPGLDLDLELKETTNPVQVSAGPGGSRSPISVAVKATARWASYSASRWKQRRRKLTGVLTEVRYQGLADDDEDEPDTPIHKDQNLNKQLLNHFRQLASTYQDTDQVNLEFLDQVISDGADPNSCDRYGQTVLHEVSRAWSVDVMRFFLDRGSDLLVADQFGVTPLHVASALDYQDMVHFLLELGADPEACTRLDRQTPLHFAAKNDAVDSIRLLVRGGALINCMDYKQRTPLQLAANQDRSEAARILLELGAEAGLKDSDGQLCITALIGQMSPVAQLALEKFHVTDKMTRNQYYYLNLLEPELRPPAAHLKEDDAVTEPASPLEVVVLQGKLDLIMTPVFLKLIQVKWKLFGRTGAWLLLILNFLFNVAWTTVGISVSVRRDSPQRYILPQDWWRILLILLALLLTVQEVFREVQDIWRSRRKLRLWQRWAELRVDDDLRCCHPMWPQENVFLLDQKKMIDRMTGSYCRDVWNLFDWLVYILLALSFGIHLTDVYRPSDSLHTFTLRLFSVTIIFLWLRIMKHVRAFRLMGPFIVMLGSIIGDVMCFLFLYVEIFIPYACSFWIIFGGLATIPSMQTVWGLLYSLYRITLVDEYEYNAMVRVDAVMAPLLCGTFLALSSILCVNLMIALLTDTFQRVHDNSQANAVMQQASVILQVDDSMPFLRRFYDNQYISTHCAPLADTYDEGVTTNRRDHDEMGCITMEIKETLDDFLRMQKEAESHDQSIANHEIQTGQNHQDELKAVRLELQELRSLVQDLIRTRSDHI